MKRVFFLVLALIFGLSFSFNTLAQEKTKEEKKENTTVEQQSENMTEVEEGKPFNSVCPVSTEEPDPEITYTYKGKTYALCCNNCLKKFKKDPEKYISRLDENGKLAKKKKSK